MFLEAYDDAPDYDVLNRIICAWREDEEKTREECDLDSITTEYPGCVRFQRGQQQEDGVATTKEAHRNLHQEKQGRTRPMSAHDLILHNHHQMSLNASYEPQTIEMDPIEDFKDMSDFDWDAFIAAQYENRRQEEPSRSGVVELRACWSLVQLLSHACCPYRVLLSLFGHADDSTVLVSAFVRHKRSVKKSVASSFFLTVARASFDLLAHTAVDSGLRTTTDSKRTTGAS